MLDIIKGIASCWPIQKELNDNPYYNKVEMLKMHFHLHFFAKKFGGNEILYYFCSVIAK